MKILAVHSAEDSDKKLHSAIDMWRVYWPLEELKKHVDWTIDYQRNFLPNADKYENLNDFKEEDLEEAAKHLGSYDIIFSSYQPSPFVFALLKMVEKKYGTKYVLDEDDNVYSIEPDNPFWLKSTPEDVFHMQRMVELSSYLTTTTERLKDSYKGRTEAKITVLPNFISDRYKNSVKKDGKRIDIMYFGGSNHYHDLHETGVLEALKKLMHEHKNVHFTTIGIPIDGYLPTKRAHTIEATNVTDWVEKVFPTLKCDIAIAPLRPTEFSLGKSNIKWQETTRLNAALVASTISPYAMLPVGTVTSVQNNPQSWYNGLSEMLDETKRNEQIKNAQKELKANWRLENKWTKYKEFFESI